MHRGFQQILEVKGTFAQSSAPASHQRACVSYADNERRFKVLHKPAC